MIRHFTFTPALAPALAVALALGSEARADDVVNTDLIVTGNICVGGAECEDGESFGATDLKIKGTIPELQFFDTSVAGGTTWTLSNDDTASGLFRAFTLKNEDSYDYPFIVHEDASDNAFYIGEDGQIGLGTTIPQTELHIVGGSDPGITFEDTVFNQKWQLHGNAGGFYLYDPAEFSIPFEIRGGAPDRALYVADDGDFGVGTDLPQAALHLQRDDNTAALLIEETGAGTLGQLTLRNNGITFFTLEDSSIAAGDDAGRAWNFQNQAGTVRVTTAPGGADDVEMVLDPGVNMTLEGALNSIGDGAKLVAENNSGTTAARELMALKNNGIVYFSLEDTSRAAGPGTGRAWNFQNQSGEFRVTTEPGGPSDIEMRLTPAGNMHIKGQLFTGGSCAAGCDRVFDEDYPLPTIAEQAAMMKRDRHLPNVGPTPEDGPFNITAMTGGMLNELEKAHLYIAQLHEEGADLRATVAAQQARLAEQDARLARLEALIAR
ncbi:hypothetical protein ATO6_23710 [Oceanicola sp. 22II-s10i]|uniref:hypothetical protein n=1 Tax=Oceanicola sp. 22II-s10i TaxID=1317116 RepID=UPI000B52617F|nr:hypothetical protein [Oceanicola sp. 22II-s10i]OWU81690.1 hypothetical protein ATO6_23710 [Oceanicola sp. 22II-s10i]